jgi:aspartate racemase
MLRRTLLTPAGSDQDHVPAILWSDPRIPDRAAARRGLGPDPLPWLMRGIHGLRQAGCGAIAIPCNTAHGWYSSMAEAAVLPILHIVDAAAADLLRIGIASGPVGVMGIEATLAMRLYQDRLGGQGWDIIEPEAAQMQRLVTPAIQAVKTNRVAEAHDPLVEVVNSLAARGATAVVLGCTEIPLAIQAGPADALRVPVVDTIDALARAAIRWARDEAD